MCLRLVHIGNQCFVIIFFPFNNYHKYTPNSAYYFNHEESREFFKIKRGRENLYKIKRGREQKSLGSPVLDLKHESYHK